MKCNPAAGARRVWQLGRQHALSVFDLSLQGALLAVLLLETNVYLLLQRGAPAAPWAAFLEDYVVMIAGSAEFLLAVAVSWVGRRRRQYSLAICFMLTSLSALLVFAFPFSDNERQPYVELCSGEPILLSEYINDAKAVNNDIIDNNFVARTIVLLATAIMCAITKLCIWVHGLTYLDDHQPQNGPFYYGILISIRLSLGLSAARWLRAVALSAAWWRCLLPLSLLPLLFAAVFALFPATLQHQAPQLTQSEFKESFRRVIKTKFVMLLTVAIAMLQLALLSITQYDAAYVQGRFHMEAFHQNPMASRATSDIFRPLVILFFIMIFRVRFSVRRSDGVKASTAARVGGAVSLVAATLCAALAAAHCPTVRAAPLQPACSRHCTCASVRHEFTPVCGLDTFETYFSPCDAGCDQYEDLNGFILFQNCTCGLQRVVRGSCSLSDCNVAYSVYQVLHTVLIAVAGSGLLMQGMAVLRSVKQNDKTLALGVSFAVIALINDVLGRLLYILISLSSCSVRSGGACVLHGASIWRVPAVSAALAALSAATSFVASTFPTPFI